MKSGSRPTARRPRGAVVVGLLLLALVLAGLLAHQAQDAVRSHRAAAESALRDYAAFAGWEYGHRLKKTLELNVVHPILWYVQNADSGLAFPAKKYLLKGCDKAAILGIPMRSAFAVRLETGEELWTDSGAVPVAVREWVRDSLPAHARKVYGKDWDYAWQIRTLGGEPQLIVYTLKPHGGHPRPDAYGFVADARGLAPLLREQFHGPSLLPRALSAGIPNDSLLAARVLTPGGALLFASSGEHDPRLSVEETFGGERDGFVVQIAMLPQSAEALVIGGLPRSRLPLLALLLVLTAGLIAAAIFQLRREYELARLRSEFVSSVSHELRTPLAQIRMFGETLLLGRVRTDEEHRRSLEIIDQEARRLSHLVENVLHFSRSERQMTRIERERVEIPRLLKEVVEGFAPLARARGVRVRVLADEGVAAQADPKALRQVLLNLLDNALKYGPAGQTVTLSAALRGNRVRLSVEDEGPGLPDRERERAWDAFWRSERETRSGVAGAGIGLAVVKEIALLHGGRVWVEDGSGVGARFVVELPDAWRTPGTPEEEIHEQASVAGPGEDGTQPRADAAQKEGVA